MTSYYDQEGWVYLDTHHEESELSRRLQQRLNQLEHLVLFSFGNSVELNNPRPIWMPKLKYLRVDSVEHHDIQVGHKNH